MDHLLSITHLIVLFSFVCYFVLSVVVIREENQGNNIFIQGLSQGQNQPKNSKIRSGIGCVDENISQGRSYDGVDCNISDCVFIRMEEYLDKGGVIYAQSSSVKVFISNSMFYNCMSSRNGGAICFDTCDQFALKTTCISNCKTGDSYSGHFAYLRVYNENSLEFCSITSCSTDTLGMYPVFLYLGDQKILHLNFSLNNARMGSSFRSYNPNTFLSNYCTFSNNNASESICISFYNSYGSFLVSVPIQYSNIVNNNSPSLGLILSYDVSVTFKYCIFDQNHDVLFYSQIKSISLMDCYVSHLGILTSFEPISSSINNSFTKIQTNHIQYFQSYFCYADDPHIELPMSRTIESTLTPQESSSSTLLIIGASATTAVAVPSIIYFGSKYFRSSTNQQISPSMDP